MLLAGGSYVSAARSLWGDRSGSRHTVLAGGVPGALMCIALLGLSDLARLVSQLCRVSVEVVVLGSFVMLMIDLAIVGITSSLNRRRLS